MDLSSFFSVLGQCFSGISQGYGLMAGLFMLGLIGSAGHCVVMCGPFVIAQSGQMEKLKGALLLPYHLGRITTYVMLAVVFSSVLNLAFFFLPGREWVAAFLLLLAGVVFLVTAFPKLVHVFPWVRFLNITLPQRWLSTVLKASSSHTSIIRRYVMGIVLGFMPCGLVVSALLASVSAPSSVQSGLAMAAFGAGTIPALVITAFGARVLRQKFPQHTYKMTKVFMMISAVWLFTLAGAILL